MSTEFYDNEGNIAFLRYYGGSTQGMCIDFFTRENRDRVLDLYVQNIFFDSEGCASLTFTFGFSDMDKNLEDAHWVYRDEKEQPNVEAILEAARRNSEPAKSDRILVKEADPELERLLAEEEEIERQDRQKRARIEVLANELSDIEQRMRCLVPSVAVSWSM